MITIHCTNPDCPEYGLDKTVDDTDAIEPMRPPILCGACQQEIPMEGATQ